MDFEKYAKEDLSEDLLTRVSQFSTQYEKKLIEIEGIELTLKIAKEEAQKLQRDLIPSILNEANLTLIQLKNGDKIQIKDVVRGSIKKGFEVAAFKAMKESEAQDKNCNEDLADLMIKSLWKNQFIAEDLTQEQLDAMVGAGIIFEPKKSIHWATLDKWIKSAKERGLVIPEVIGCFEYQEAKITRS